MSIVAVILWGVSGAIAAEALKQRQKWTALPEAKFRAQFRSLKFWAVVLLLTFCGGAAAYFVFEDAAGKLSAKSCCAAGAGAQALLRAMAAAGAGSKSKRFSFREADSLAPEEPTLGEILS